jgi:hypothetical protein
MTPLLLIPACIVMVGTGLALLRNVYRWTPETLCATALVVPFTLLALGDLAAQGFDMSEWEGSNYLIPALPAFIIACVAMKNRPSGGLSH